MFCVKLHSGRYGKKNTRCFRLAKRSVSFPLNSHEFGVIKSEWKCFPDQQNSGLSISCHKENQGLWPREWTIFVNLVKMLNQRLTYHFLCFWVIYSSFEEQNIWYNFKKTNLRVAFNVDIMLYYLFCWKTGLTPKNREKWWENVQI